jgi:DNA-binding NarL/FixJ family response regulator
MNVLVIDDHSLFREGLRLLLAELGFAIDTQIAGSCEEGLAKLREQPADIVLLDWHMEGLSGAEAMVAIRELVPQARQIVLSGEKSAALVRTAIDNGAVGFIAKDSEPETLLLALNTIASGGIYLPATLLSGPGRTAGPAPDNYLPSDLTQAFPELTQRQGDVLAAILRGLPNKVIARELNISDQTVKSHLSVIFRQLNVQSRTEAVYVCARQGVRIA